MKGCVLIGSGPSLNKIDVTALAEYQTVAFNRSFVAWSDWGFAPTYFVCVDEIALEDMACDIAPLSEQHPRTRFFLNSKAAQWGINEADNLHLVEVADEWRFRPDFDSITDMGNVGASSLQLLIALGYTRVMMVGVDARYSPSLAGKPIEAGFVRTDHDPDHFHADYSSGMRRLVNPDYDKFVIGWPIAAKACEELGVDVINASPSSALDCFESMDFEAGLVWLETK